jgi:asparaginyl-tRNA synthetase
MIEPEIAFGDVNDCMNLAEVFIVFNIKDYLRFLMTYVLENCIDDLKFFDERVKKGLIEYLTRLANSEF